MKNNWLFIGISLFMLSCGNSDSKTSKGEVVSTLVESEQSNTEIRAEIKRIEKEELARIQYEQSNKTSMSFDKLEHDFGNVPANSDNNTVFIVTNTGDKPLIIEDVMASCGCTTPEKPENPIPPGKSDKILVKFHPNPGQENEIRKTVTVTANTDPKVETLNIRAFVK